jgi:hypothetical protein
MISCQVAQHKSSGNTDLLPLNMRKQTPERYIDFMIVTILSMSVYLADTGIYQSDYRPGLSSTHTKS